MTLPYESARGGPNAFNAIEKILQNLGCSKVGRMNDHETNTVTIQFEWNGKQCQMKASANGYAAKYMQEHPNASKRKALEAGERAVPSILRDWIKGQVTAIETGVMSFEQVFMPHLMLPDGRTLLEAAESKFLQLENKS